MPPPFQFPPPNQHAPGIKKRALSCSPEGPEKARIENTNECAPKDGTPRLRVVQFKKFLRFSGATTLRNAKEWKLVSHPQFRMGWGVLYEYSDEKTSPFVINHFSQAKWRREHRKRSRKERGSEDPSSPPHADPEIRDSRPMLFSAYASRSSTPSLALSASRTFSCILLTSSSRSVRPAERYSTE